MHGRGRRAALPGAGPCSDRSSGPRRRQTFGRARWEKGKARTLHETRRPLLRHDFPASRLFICFDRLVVFRPGRGRASVVRHLGDAPSGNLVRLGQRRDAVGAPTAVSSMLTADRRAGLGSYSLVDVGSLNFPSIASEFSRYDSQAGFVNPEARAFTPNRAGLAAPWAFARFPSSQVPVFASARLLR